MKTGHEMNTNTALKRETSVKSNRDSTLLLFAVVVLVILNLEIQSAALEVIYIIMAVILALKDVKMAYILYFIFSYSNKYFKRSIGDLSQSLLVLAIFASTLIVTQRNSGIRIKKKVAIGCLLIILTTFISYLVSIQPDTAAMISILLDIVLFISIQNVFKTENDIGYFINKLIPCVNIVSLYLCIKVLAFPVRYGNTLGYQYISIAKDINPNTLSQILVQAMAILLFTTTFRNLYKKNASSEKLNYIMILLLVLTIIRIGSRGALITTVFSLFIIQIFNSMLNKKPIKRLLVFWGSLLMIAITIYVVISKIPALAQRFTFSNLMDTGGGSRLLAIQTLFKYVIPSHLWFGVGLGSANESIAILKYISYGSGSTNMFVAILAELGIVGFIIYFLFFGKILKSGITEMRRTHNYYVVVFSAMSIITVIHGISEVVFYERYFWNNFIMLFSIVQLLKKRNLIG